MADKNFKDITTMVYYNPYDKQHSDIYNAHCFIMKKELSSSQYKFKDDVSSSVISSYRDDEFVLDEHITKKVVSSGSSTGSKWIEIVNTSKYSDLTVSFNPSQENFSSYTVCKSSNGWNHNVISVTSGGTISISGPVKYDKNRSKNVKEVSTLNFDFTGGSGDSVICVSSY